MKASKKENILIITLIGAILLILFGMDWRPEYSTDTIDLAERGFFALSQQFFENGRFVTALMMALWGWAGKGIPTLYTCNWAGALVLLLVTFFILQREYKDEIKNPVERTLITTLLLINPFIIEYFLFIETASHCFSMLCASVAAITYSRFMSTKKLRYLPITLGVLFLSAFSYQAVTGIFISLTICFACRHATPNKSATADKSDAAVKSAKAVKSATADKSNASPVQKNRPLPFLLYIRNLAIAAVLYAIPLAVNLYHISRHSFNERLEATRDFEATGNIFQRFISTMKRVPSFLKHNYAILPKNLFWNLMLVFAIISLVFIIKNAILDKKNITVNVLALVCISLVIPAVSTASITMGSGWFMPRVVYPIGSIFGVLLLNLRINIWPDNEKNTAGDILSKEKTKKTASIIMIAAIGSYLFISMLCFTRIFVERYQMNAADRARSLEIQQCIEKYEKSGGSSITKIAVYNDNFSSKPYGIDDEGGMTASSFATKWSDVAGINFYTGEHYERAEKSPEAEDFFEQNKKEWNSFSEEQLYFEGDTLHMWRW